MSKGTLPHHKNDPRYLFRHHIDATQAAHKFRRRATREAKWRAELADAVKSKVDNEKARTKVSEEMLTLHALPPEKTTAETYVRITELRMAYDKAAAAVGKALLESSLLHDKINGPGAPQPMTPEESANYNVLGTFVDVDPIELRFAASLKRVDVD